MRRAGELGRRWAGFNDNAREMIRCDSKVANRGVDRNLLLGDKREGLGTAVPHRGPGAEAPRNRRHANFQLGLGNMHPCPPSVYMAVYVTCNANANQFLTNFLSYIRLYNKYERYYGSGREYAQQL